jgi:hypothetical protein
MPYSEGLTPWEKRRRVKVSIFDRTLHQKAFRAAKVGPGFLNFRMSHFEGL